MPLDVEAINTNHGHRNEITPLFNEIEDCWMFVNPAVVHDND
jgi:hypothetical protein